MTLLILYEELAAYFVKCISVFSERYNVDVHIIRKDVNKEAPFHLTMGNIHTYDRSKYSYDQLVKLVQKIKPDAIFCGGWSNKSYLKIVSNYKNKVPAVFGFDNKWTGSLKQRLASILAPVYITNRFDRCFVPGAEQKQFAIKMGFVEDRIAIGAYCCDVDYFYDQYILNREPKGHNFPKRFIFVGRYYHFKGIQDLWNAFIQLQNESPNAWELWCLGTGDIEPFKHDKIKHFGFVQPKDLSSYIKETGVFVLPSHFEPWGVVVHEFAAAGFPIICSDAVGARTAFVEDTINGYIYKAGQIEQLKVQLKKMMELDTNQLEKMASNSVEKAKMNTPELWADTLMSLLKK